MLTLRRKIDQEIEISGGIVVKILRFDGAAVYVGVTAPTSVAIMRAEMSAKSKEWLMAKAAEAGRDERLSNAGEAAGGTS